MIAAAERTEAATLATASERRVELTCQACGRTLGLFGIRGHLPPGTVWTRLRCPDRRCTRWNAFDVATGKPLGKPG